MPGVTARSGTEARQEKPTANGVQNEDQDAPQAGWDSKAGGHTCPCKPGPRDLEAGGGVQLPAG